MAFGQDKSLPAIYDTTGSKSNQLKSVGTKSLAVLLTAGSTSDGILSGYKSEQNLNKTQKGGIGGALIGGIIGRGKGNTALGAMLLP